ncbi:MFS transporter [Parvibaculum sedimenti]|uniref:MFS transporter n=1 Tax=Parvibaculum sedimenti TaxID=2608632 RepID=A0A6N6VLA3_9HYPH|nr:peptide MFS transporter [Parvibaculum sedimenti]KAB7741517.1 MFS transporter [Parvibaculum sedimenti]
MTARSPDLFGQPRGLAFLFGTEMWERFSYYGMRALLTLYMVKYLLLPENRDRVLGLDALRGIFESVFGPLDAQPFASQIYGSYTALVYLTPVLGGYIADRWLGHRRTVIIGALLMALGHFMMAVEHLFLFALLALILGNGAFKPNISSQVGTLYAPGDARRDRAYSIFYVGINLGAFLAPLVCGTLGERIGWHYGFAAAGIGMLIAIAIYHFGAPDLPAEMPRAATAAPRAPLTRDDWRSIGSLGLLCVFVAFFWATYEQQGNTIALWADGYTDRAVNLLVWRGEVPTTWFQSLNPFMIFAFTPFVVALWARQSRRGTEPSTLVKMSLGCLGVALGNLIMVAAAYEAGATGKASPFWLFAYFAIVTMGELYLSPTGLSFVSKIAPASLLSMLMGVWLLTNFAGNFLAGWLGSFWSGMDKGAFFLMIAGIAGAASVAIFVFDRVLRPRSLL